MLKVYYDPVSHGFYQTDIHDKIPETSVEITNKERWELVEAAAKGKDISVTDGDILLKDKEISEDFIIYTERCWRNSELIRADIELAKVQDSDPKNKGSVTEWRAYRKELRSWPEQHGFPNKNNRPVAPDLKEE